MSSSASTFKCLFACVPLFCNSPAHFLSYFLCLTWPVLKCKMKNIFEQISVLYKFIHLLHFNLWVNSSSFSTEYCFASLKVYSALFCPASQWEASVGLNWPMRGQEPIIWPLPGDTRQSWPTQTLLIPALHWGQHQPIRGQYLCKLTNQRPGKWLFVVQDAKCFNKFIWKCVRPAVWSTQLPLCVIRLSFVSYAVI